MNRANNYSTWSPFPYSVEKKNISEIMIGLSMRGKETNENDSRKSDHRINI